MILRLPYIQTIKDGPGKERIYFRRRGFAPVRLPPSADPGFLAAYHAALAKTERKTASRVPERSMEALSRSYLQSVAFGQLGPTTQAVYRRLIADLNRKHGDKPAPTLSGPVIERMMMARSATPAAANHLLRTLRALMRHAVKLGWRTNDPTRDVGRLPEAGQGAETWTEADIAAFEARWPAGTRPGLALALLLYTGQRRSDVVRMGRQHVQNGTIRVRQVKTGAELVLPLHPDLAGMIAAETDRLTFLMTEAGKPFTPNGFYMRFREWVRAAGLPDGRSPHGLRKAAARRLAEAGCTAHQIAAVTGHRTLAEVQRYTQAADQERLAGQAVARIGRPAKTGGV